MGAHHQRHEVALSVADAHMACLGQLCRLFCDALVAFNPAAAFEHSGTLALRVFGLACPHPGVGDAQGLTLRRDHVGRVQVHAALGFIAQRPQTLHLLAVVVQLRRVLQAQHHLVLGDALHTGLPVCVHDLLRCDRCVVQETVGRHCL